MGFKIDEVVSWLLLVFIIMYFVYIVMVFKFMVFRKGI